MRKVLLLALCAACGTGQPGAAAPSGRPALMEAGAAGLDAIRPASLRAHVLFLADDALEGRAPGSPGFRIAARYVATQLAGLGLAPAGERGGYFQDVPLRSMKRDEAGCSLEVAGKSVAAEHVIFTPFAGNPKVDVKGPLVYAGYGIAAPDQRYDDLSSAELRGAIAVVLRGAPPAFAPATTRALYSDFELKAQRLAASGAAAVVVRRHPRGREAPVLGPAARRQQLRVDGVDGRLATRRRHPHPARHRRHDRFPGPARRRRRGGAGARGGRRPGPAAGARPPGPASRGDQLPRPQLAQRGGGAAGQRSAAGRRVRGLLRPPRPPRGRHPGRRRLHLQRGARRRGRGRRPPRDRARLHFPAGAPAALDPLPRRHRRGAGAPGLRLLRPPPDGRHPLDRGERQPRRTEPALRDVRHRPARGRALDAAAQRGRGGVGDEDHRLRGSGARAGLLHPLRSVQLRQEGHPVALPARRREGQVGPQTRNHALFEGWMAKHYHQPSDEWRDGEYHADHLAKEVRLDFLIGLSIARQPARPTWNPDDIFTTTFAPR